MATSSEPHIIDNQSLSFAWEHRFDDPYRLLLQRHSSIDLPLVADQIEGWHTASTKWPSLQEASFFRFPPRLNREQSSSEMAASYKANIVSPLGPSADLTGGMGIDTIALARVASQFYYVEQSPLLHSLFAANLPHFNLPNISHHCADSIQWLTQSNHHFDLLYLDPARRDSSGHKVVAFESCCPDILLHLPLLRKCSDRLLVKASPMIDLRAASRQLDSVSEIHILAIKGECKEILFLCSTPTVEPLIIAINLTPTSTQSFSFHPSDEQAASPIFASSLHRFLFEPHAALMKAAPFSLICHRFALQKLDRNTHLYTSDNPTPHFPGRRFEILSEVSLNTKSILRSLPERKAHLVVRNYPVPADALRHQLHIQEGGELFLFATLFAGRKTGLLCRRILD